MFCSPQYLVSLLAAPRCGRAKVKGLLELLQRQQIAPEQFWQHPERIRSVAVQLRSFDEVCEGVKTFQKRWSVSSYWEHLVAHDIQVLSMDDAAYPGFLRQIPDYPLALFMKGDPSCLRPTCIALVGSRRPTKYGQWVTQKIVADLSEHDVSIISGFMAGIDYQAHLTALQLGLCSVGVLGFGFGSFYPAHLRRAAEEFLDAGKLFITEYPPDTPPAPGQFPARNRIVAGLSQATIVVEAQQKSGSLITAACALEYNRLVGAVPGSIDSASSSGTNHLIQQGALLVRSGEDIWNELHPSAVKS